MKTIDPILTPQLVKLCLVLVAMLVACLAYIAWLHSNRRALRRSQKELKRSLRNLNRRDQGEPILSPITKP